MSKGTPVRHIRVPDELWTAARAKAESEGTSATAVCVAALEKYVDK